MELNINTRMDPLEIYKISKYITYLKIATERQWEVVFNNRAITSRGKKLVLAVMIELYDKLKTYDICQEEVKRLSELIEEFRKYYTKPGTPTQLSQQHSKELSKLIERIEGIITTELKRTFLFEIDTKSGLLNYDYLLKNGFSALFTSKELETELPEVIQNDLNESIKALIFDIPTASAMISLRAVEGGLREIYKTIKGTDCKLNWKKAIDEVESELEKLSLESKSLEGYLDHFRKVRNEAEHPDRIFTKKEAEHILVHSAYAIEEIYKIIGKIKSLKNH